MAVIKNITLVCDRCKKEMLHSQLKKQIFRLKRGVMEVHRECYEYPSDSMYYQTNDVELCRDCAKALDKWLKTPPVEEGR